MDKGQVYLDFDSMKDKRYKNYLLALSMFINDIVKIAESSCDLACTELQDILKKYNISVVGMDNEDFPRINIDFPDGIERMQYFKNEDGSFYKKLVK